jgi:hypothetical protein
MCFVDGTQIGATTADAANFNTIFGIVWGNRAQHTAFASAYMDEMRISNIARWTANFTRPFIGLQQLGENVREITTRIIQSSVEVDPLSSRRRAAFHGASPVAGRHWRSDQTVTGHGV